MPRGTPRRPTNPTQPPADPYLISVPRAAQLVGCDRKKFGHWWDPTVGGWRIPIGNGDSVVVHAVYVGTARRVPRVPLEQALATLKAS